MSNCQKFIKTSRPHLTNIWREIHIRRRNGSLFLHSKQYSGKSVKSMKPDRNSSLVIIMFLQQQINFSVP